MDEVLEHVERASGGELRDHVTRASDGSEGETRGRVGGLPASDLRSVDGILVVPRDPVVGRRSKVEFERNPLGSTGPRDNRVSVTGVDQNADVVFDEGPVVGQHALSGGRVLERVGADAPVNVVDVESGARDVAVEVVLRVIGVNARNLLKHAECAAIDGVLGRKESLAHLGVELSTIEASAVHPVRVDVVVAIVRLLQCARAGEAIGVAWASRHDGSVDAGAHESVAIREGHPRLQSAFRLRVRHWVAATGSNEVDLRVRASCIALDNLGCQSRHVHARVRLSEDEEWLRLVRRRLLEELQQEVQVISGRRGIIAVVVRQVIGISVSYSNRALQIEHRSYRRPTVPISRPRRALLAVILALKIVQVNDNRQKEVEIAKWEGRGVKKSEKPAKSYA